MSVCMRGGFPKVRITDGCLKVRISNNTYNNKNASGPYMQRRSVTVAAPPVCFNAKLTVKFSIETAVCALYTDNDAVYTGTVRGIY